MEKFNQSKNVCGAKLRNKDARCKRSGLANGRCRLHGGKTPAGVASPNFKHGNFSKYAKFLPANLKENYETALNDEELRTLSHELALSDARAFELLEKMQENETQAAWSELNKILERFDNAKPGAYSPDAVIADVRKMVANGVEESKRWLEIYALVEQRRKLVASEASRLKELQQTLTVEQAYALVALVVGAVKRHCPSESIAAVSADIASGLSKQQTNSANQQTIKF